MQVNNGTFLSLVYKNFGTNLNQQTLKCGVVTLSILCQYICTLIVNTIYDTVFKKQVLTY